MSGTQQPQRDELRLMDDALRSVAEESCTPLADVFFKDEYAHDAPEDFHLPPPGAKRAARIVLEAAAEYSAQHAPYSHDSSDQRSSGPRSGPHSSVCGGCMRMCALCTVQTKAV